jgi:hypothetical protein
VLTYKLIEYGQVFCWLKRSWLLYPTYSDMRDYEFQGRRSGKPYVFSWFLMTENRAANTISSSSSKARSGKTIMAIGMGAQHSNSL